MTPLGISWGLELLTVEVGCNGEVWAPVGGMAVGVVLVSEDKAGRRQGLPVMMGRW